ncbi:hypothetical protein ACFQ9Q_38310 [Streptomyces virginiae]|uniref:hypothetical protein n=1 Tax=Streptomyces virginiae TaxID=1961 RepID=UPI0036C17805
MAEISADRATGRGFRHALGFKRLRLDVGVEGCARDRGSVRRLIARGVGPLAVLGEVRMIDRLWVDRMAPLAEAWDSCASSQTAQRREAYANDQGQPASLVAVAARSNRSKADQDPAEWLPPAPDALCRYGAERTATKLRWGLAVDEAERDRLFDIAAGCGGTDVEFTPAP